MFGPGLSKLTANYTAFFTHRYAIAKARPQF